ncbi:hypothetical protein AB0H76_02695 [Nocardia sp. NPDC050712]|uniref:hypothetical protein n=1 Tax=Nocardia sp. NPDC050712 TaxID=3155518 RepID=UPI0034078834
MSTPVDLDHRGHDRDHDLVLVLQLSNPPLRRLVRVAVGLSEESIELLTRISERMRAAEGALPDPAMN